MRTRDGADKPGAGGNGATREDGLHSKCGGSGDVSGHAPNPQKQAADASGSGPNEGVFTVRTAPWFDPVDLAGECKDGVCPVPWVTHESQSKTENTVIESDTADLVNHPPHYTNSSIECIEAIEAQLTPEEFRGYLKGNVAKYIWRERHKGQIQSLKKAGWYLDLLIRFDSNG